MIFPSSSPMPECRLASKIIYGLCEPQTWLLRYIGKSSSGLVRPRRHTHKTALKLRDHCHNWIRSLVESGRKPEIIVLETLPDDSSAAELKNAEIRLISFFRSLGYPLTNLTDGGEGTSGYKQSEETRRKIGEANRVSLLGNVPWNKGLRTGRPAWNRGVSPSLETRAKMSKAKKLHLSGGA